jgi:hypothetical protein
MGETSEGKIMSMMGDQDHKHVFTDDRLLAVSVKVKGKNEPKIGNGVYFNNEIKMGIDF